MLRVLTFLMLLILLYISGCGGDDEVIEDVPVNFLRAFPPEGVELAAHASISLEFDGNPKDVNSNVGEVSVTNRIVTINKLPWPASPAAKLDVVVTWADGEVILFYYMTAPCADPEGACQ